MVVTGGNIRHQRPQHVERRFGALFHLFFDVKLDLVHGHVSGPFYHHLHVMFPGAAGQLTEGFQFRQLRLIGGIVGATGTQGIPQTEGHIVLFKNFDDVVEMGVEGVLLVVVQHPLGNNPAPARDDAGDAAAHFGQMFDQDTRMDGHVIDPLLGVLFDDVEEILGGEVFDIAVDAF